jgi:hypothetical protein
VPADAKEIGCGEMRHGVIIETGRQIHKRTSESECRRLVEERLITGCAALFHTALDCSVHPPRLVVTRSASPPPLSLPPPPPAGPLRSPTSPSASSSRSRVAPRAM